MEALKWINSILNKPEEIKDYVISSRKDMLEFLKAIITQTIPCLEIKISHHWSESLAW
jgi:hypothetical protein